MNGDESYKGKGLTSENPDFKRAVRRVMKEHNISANDIAQALNISVASLNMQISGNPTVNRLRAIAEVIGCDVVDFFKDEARHKSCEDSSEFVALIHYKDKNLFVSSLSELKDLVMQLEAMENKEL